MADIFVSYARADQERVAPLVAALEAQGFSIWWDPAITGGQEFDALITQQLEEARAAIVVWTADSVASRWVRGEARIAADRGIIVPIQLGTPNLPIDARALHTIDLNAWNGEAQSAPFQELLRSLKYLMAQSGIAPSALAPSHAVPPKSATISAPLTSAWQSLKPWHFGVFAGVLVVAIAIAVFMTRSVPTGAAKATNTSASRATAAESSVSGSPPQHPSSRKPRIAVMPFENLSPDPANAFFTDGMQEEILTKLANSAPGLEVISRTTMMTYKDHPTTVEQVAKDLGVTHVLEGSVRREGNEVRLTLQLIDARDDSHVWAEDYDRTLTNALSLESEVASEVASQLSLKLLAGAGGASAPTTSPQAYDLYLKAVLGSQQASPGTPRAQITGTQDLLSRAIALDPNFTSAYLLRSAIRLRTFAGNYDVSEENVKGARFDLDAAERLAPGDGGVLAGEAQYTALIGRDNTKAMELYRKIDSLGLASSAGLIGEAEVLMSLARPGEAIAAAERALALDPLSKATQGNFMATLWGALEPERSYDVIVHQMDSVGLALVFKLSFLGDTREFVSILDAVAAGRSSPLALSTSVDPETIPETAFDVYSMAHRYQDLRRFLDATPLTTARVADAFHMYILPGVGRAPIARLRGWTDLLLGDKTTAAREGQAVLDFVAKSKVTPWNGWFLRQLAAQGYTFTGDKTHAIASAKAALTLIPRSRDAVLWLPAAMGAAQVYAWSGDEEDAADLLEQVADARPSVGYAEIARSPLFTVPLANNARFQALKAKLEAQIAAIKLD